MEWSFHSNQPIYTQLIEQLTLAILSGEYPTGGKLPAVRELAAEAGDKLRERPTRIFALSDNGLVARDARQLPALADIPPSGADALVGRDLFAAPDQGFELRRESKRSHRMLFFFVKSMISGI